ncbi:phosphate transporter, partial [Parathielavia appendiculata]
FGNGANDVANSYATSVAARALTMPQVGFLSMITEFVGAVGLGSHVTGTIKDDIIDTTRFETTPEVLLLAMACAEFGSAFWFILATRMGFPVSTTQTVVGALVGVGIAAQAQVQWAWEDGSVSQIAASWGIAPLLAAAFSAILFTTLKFCGVLALFITIEASGIGLDELGPGRAVGIVLGTFGGCLLVGYDARLRVWHLPIYHPRRLWGFVKYFFLQGVKRDWVDRYDNRVEHLWTYAQVASAMMMSIAHGSNDVANAVGPWVAAYDVWRRGIVEEDVSTTVWILSIAGFLLGAGVWFFGYHIIRSLGNKITQLSPTRGYAMELDAAITVLLASRLGLPVSTTLCLTGALFDVALINLDFGSVNWRQLGFIYIGWVLTLPTAGRIAGLLMAMSLNTPHFA